MKSLAVVRATDILKLRSTLLEMNRAGLSFKSIPKEINPASIEKLFSNGFDYGKKYEVCALVPLAQDYEFSLGRAQSLPHFYNLLILNSSHELFKEFVKLKFILPDLVIPRIYSKEENEQTSYSTERASTIYLGVFVNRMVQVQTDSGSIYTGVIKHADSIGIFFEPNDNSAQLFITWHDIKKIIIPRQEKK